MERPLPSNIEAESGVLGSIIIDPEAIIQVADFLYADDFYREAHRTIYETIVRLWGRSEPADFITLCEELERLGRLENVGGASYITSLVNQVPTSGNVEFYARIVERAATLRRLIHAAGQIAAIAYAGEGDVDAVLEKAEQLLFAISQRRVRNDFSPLKEILAVYLETLDRLYQNRGSIVGIPTGFRELDHLSGGLQRSGLILVAARPSLGKSSFALSLARNAAKRGFSVAIFSLEMSKEQLVQRLVSMDAGIDQQHLRSGWIKDDEWDRIVYASETLAEANIWIDDTAVLTPLEMRTKARRLQMKYGIDLIIVDYLQLMQSRAGDTRNLNRVQELDEISRGLKALARELNVLVLALAQLSRAVEGRQSKVPQLSDLRDSGALEQAADIVTFIYRDDVYNPDSERKHIADIIIAKHRNGPTGEVPLYFQASQTLFRDIEVSPEESYV